MRRTSIVVVAILVLALLAAWSLTRNDTGAPEYVGQASTDVGSWSTYRDAEIGWALRYPPLWHQQVGQPDQSDLACNGDTVVVMNFIADLQHPGLGEGSCIGVWDMRDLRRNFVIVQLEVPADLRPGPEISQRTTPLSLDEALKGHQMARFGVPRGVWIPVYIDEGHQYIVRVWHGPDASSQDMAIADGVVGSMRFET